ncbi:MAG: hypothetical protein COY40_01880 [Alphaproteobacteria bacterium CG_4_10_14_0_8_um_filter_53_9]|nr:MAG: hypothetical protein COY40_01880 [Alphaproteobacteria bacterium CG_4_10_14_0_8_um_filter_53_9]
MTDKIFFIYILTNANNTVLYIGLTSDISKRLWEHENGIYEKAFTKKYNITKLIYVEIFGSAEHASHREYTLKRWQRTWKEKLIAQTNPMWEDIREKYI